MVQLWSRDSSSRGTHATCIPSGCVLTTGNSAAQEAEMVRICTLVCVWLKCMYITPTCSLDLVCSRCVGSGDVEAGGAPALSSAAMAATTAATSEAEWVKINLSRLFNLYVHHYYAMTIVTVPCMSQATSDQGWDEGAHRWPLQGIYGPPWPVSSWCGAENSFTARIVRNCLCPCPSHNPDATEDSHGFHCTQAYREDQMWRGSSASGSWDI